MTENLEPKLHANIIYAYCCGYLERNGWRREEEGSGWWWHEHEDDLVLLGEAIDRQLTKDGIDTRVEP